MLGPKLRGVEHSISAVKLRQSRQLLQRLPLRLRGALIGPPGWVDRKSIMAG